MDKITKYIKKFNSLENFQYRLAFYIGLVVIFIDMFLFKHYWFEDFFSIILLPIIAYVIGCVICVPAWMMADINKQVQNLIEKESSIQADNENKV